MDDMFERELDDLAPHIEDDLRNGEFIMINPIVIECLDPIIHTPEHPFCDQQDCPCQLDVEPLPEDETDGQWVNGDEEDDETGTHPPDCDCYYCSAE
jgi:hypothetical protein